MIHVNRFRVLALLAAPLVAGGLVGCSRDDQIKAQEAARKAPGELRRAADQAVRGTRGAVGRATESADDLALAAKVKGALLLNRRLKGARIDVAAEKGVVTLRGRVLRRGQRDVAAEIAREVPGVREVETDLELADPEPK